MSVNPSPIAGFAGQFFDNNGVILSGGKIFTYAAGTTTPQATYTSALGVTPHANPIVLDSAGRVPGGEIWLTDSLIYKFVIETSTAVLIGTYDNITGVNSNFVNYTVQEEVITATAGQTVFNLTTINYAPGTNSLSVYIDGVNQYVGDSYLETDSNTVTFTSGLHVGAEVKFTTAVQVATGAVSASDVGYVYPATGAVAQTVQERLEQYVSVKDFGAVGDGVADDHAAIQAACDTGRPVVFPNGIYNFGTYASPQNLTLTNDNQTLFFQGSDVRFVGKGGIDVDADNVTLDLQGGTLGQYIGYAEVAVQTVNGSNQITVVDASKLTIGQDVASSWGDTAGSGVYPLGGPTGLVKRRITNIVGNVVTLDTNMTSGDVLVPQVIFGDFTFGVFLQCFRNNFTVKDGTLERVTGYYYHTPNGVIGIPIVPGGSVYFQNIVFNGNGTDQFLVKHNQKLHFQNCRAIQQWDTAKTGVYFADDGSVYMTDCDMALGNFDASFTLNNIWDGSFTGGEIVLSNSNFTGKTRFVSPPPASQGADCLNAIELLYEGTFNRISASNCRFASYTRHFVGSTVLTQTKSTTLESLRVDNCLIDGSFAYFLHSGAGNGFTGGFGQVSNTYFFQRNPFTFYNLSAITGAVSSFGLSFNNCYFNFGGSMAGFTSFNGPITVTDSTFNMNSIAFQHSSGQAELDNCTFTNSPVIQISPTFDENFYGELSRIVIDDPAFPATPDTVFDALGGSSLSGAKLATARSINGSVFYDVYKLNTGIFVSGTFSKANGVYKLRADDYYIPIGSNIKDMYLGTIQRVTFNRATTLASTAATGATSIVVTDATGVAAGDLVNILLDDVLVDTLVVDGSYAGGTTIPLTSATTGDAASGNKVNFFRVAAL